jgi:HD-like signal output (HDOD) protein
VTTSHDELGLGDLRLRLVQELRDRLLGQAISMPLGNQQALSEVAALCRSPETDSGAVAAKVALDEGFAATLLRVANSAALAGASRVDDLATAVARLGFCFVECLAIAAPSLRILATAHDGLETARHELHRHAVRTGVLARVLAPPAILPDQALAAGLVHNVGLSVLSIHARSGFRKVMEAAATGEQLPEVEHRLFGFSHPELGALLGESWGYPTELVTVIREHADEHPSTQLAALVQVADLLVRAAGMGVEPPRLLSPAVAATAGVDPVAASDVATRLLSPVEEEPEGDAALAEVLDAVA